MKIYPISAFIGMGMLVVGVFIMSLLTDEHAESKKRRKKKPRK